MAVPMQNNVEANPVKVKATVAEAISLKQRNIQDVADRHEKRRISHLEPYAVDYGLYKALFLRWFFGTYKNVIL